MTLSQVISKINWRLILIHLVAYWFLYEAAVFFSFLYDDHFFFSFIKLHPGTTWLTKTGNNEISNDDYIRLANDSRYLLELPAISLLVAPILSTATCFLRRWFWLNALITFILAISLFILWKQFKIELTPSTILGFILNKPGYLFKDTFWFLIANGSFSLLIALYLFFSKSIARFITMFKLAVLYPSR